MALKKEREIARYDNKALERDRASQCHRQIISIHLKKDGLNTKIHTQIEINVKIIENNEA